MFNDEGHLGVSDSNEMQEASIPRRTKVGLIWHDGCKHKANGGLKVNKSIKITFGMIVLNGEPFVRFNLRALYSFAHQIIVVEGACPGAKGVADSRGHSKDGTLDTLRRFQKEEDPEGKLIVVTAEDDSHLDGFWIEKDEMSFAYAKRANGNYLWQIDADEFYTPEDMQSVIDLLEADPTITAVSFRTHTFWGSLDYVVDGFALRYGDRDFHRLFAWADGYIYSSHRPPTVLDRNGRDLRHINWIRAHEMAKRKIFMYHYALLLPKQVIEKFEYYATLDWPFLKNTDRWAQDYYMNLSHPFHVYYGHRSLSWIKRFQKR